MFDSLIAALNESLKNPENERTVLEQGERLSSLQGQEFEELFRRLVEFATENQERPWTRIVILLFSQLPLIPLKSAFSSVCRDIVVKLYDLCPANDMLRNQLLGILAQMGSFDEWADLICSNPPETAEGIEAAFIPLVKDGSKGIDEHLLMRLVTEATNNKTVAASIYELANHEFRIGNISQHPLANRTEQMTGLVGAVIGKLAMIEEGNLPAGTEPEQISRIVQESVSLIIALIDSLALLNVEQAAGKMVQAIQLKHRRIQVEAAAALAKMGDDAGKRKLLEMAEHPVVRPRVIAYAKELGFEKDISLEHRGPIATAETALALWLSQGEQMGLAPTAMKLVDQRELYWPSYEDPISCFLFQFEYGSGDNAYRNVGISGPVTHAFTADINDLPVTDHYSAFAGWQTISDEIFIVPAERAEKLMSVETDRLKRKMAEQPIDECEIQVVISFFSENALVATGKRDEMAGTLIVEDDLASWIEQGNSDAPIDWQLALEIWKGRKLLTNFNPAFS